MLETVTGAVAAYSAATLGALTGLSSAATTVGTMGVVQSVGGMATGWRQLLLVVPL